MVRHWVTREIPKAQVAAHCGDQRISTQANDEGYFELDLPVSQLSSDPEFWQEIDVRLEAPEAANAPVSIQARVQIPSAKCQFGVISDIDDTVIHTGATNWWQMIKTTFLGSVHTRAVFPGVAAFYGALARGAAGDVRHPFFYVTSSPWNLYPFLCQVFELKKIPSGMLFMTDWGIDRTKFFKKSHHRHKLEAISRVMRFYANLPFILLGDSGQKDPEIYREILKQFPGRVLAIYIRDVTRKGRDAEVNELGLEASQIGVDYLLVKDTMEAAQHAVRQGYIDERELVAIEGDKAADEGSIQGQ